MSKYNEKDWKAFVDEYVANGEWDRIVKTQRLTDEEEIALLREAANGSDSALTRLIYSYLRFIIRIAWEQEKKKGVRLSDLVTKGKYGFTKAVFRFDTTNGNGIRFRRYAIWWIGIAITMDKEDFEKKVKELEDLTEFTLEDLELKDLFTDPRDGKVYRTVKIGTQTWMAENFNYECEGSVCYNDDPANAEIYGRLYDWETAKKSAPPGWHLPSDEEWKILANFAEGIDRGMAGKKLKATRGWQWQENDFSGIDEFDFRALPGHLGQPQKDKILYVPFLKAMFWSATDKSDKISKRAGVFDIDIGDDITQYHIPNIAWLSVRYLKDDVYNEEDVLKLVQEASNGSEAAMNSIIDLYLSQIVKSAERFVVENAELSELITLGKYAFAKAVFSYEPKEYTKFISNAVMFMQNCQMRRICSSEPFIDIDETNWYQKALEQDKRSENYGWHKGRAYAYYCMKKGDYDKAIEDLSKAMELDPTNENTSNMLSYCKCMLEQKGG